MKMMVEYMPQCWFCCKNISPLRAFLGHWPSWLNL